jgi:hypothetical protein
MGPEQQLVGAGGSLTRQKDQDRIEFLAQARNRALEPLWLNSSSATSTSLLLPHDAEVENTVINLCMSAHLPHRPLSSTPM